jgi:hypothetical protein
VEAVLDGLEQTAPDGATLDINLGAKMAFSVTYSWRVASRLFFRQGMTHTSFPHASYT